MAVLISAITATAVFSVILSTRHSYVKADNREAVSVAFRSAQEYLKPYVSSVPGDAAWLPTPSIYGEAIWALENGEHDITFLLANMPQLTNSTFKYVVSDTACGSAVCKQVQFNINVVN